MEEQQEAVVDTHNETEIDKTQTSDQNLFPVFMALLIIMAVALLVSLIGVTLGAINFVGPAAHYPTWILAAWLVSDILLLVFLLVHLILYAILADDVVDASTGYAVVAIIILVGGAILLFNKHFAWASICEFLLLVIATIIDFGLLSDKMTSK